MRRLILIAIAVAVLIALVVYVDFTTFFSALAGLDAVTLLLLFGLLAVGAVVKALRWAFYLRAAQLDISWRDGMKSYLGGMSAGALPGGSWLAPRLAQEHGGVLMRQAAAGLFVSFVADMIGLALLAWIAMVLNQKPANFFVLPGIGFLFGGALFTMGRSERVWHAVDRLLARRRLTRRWLPQEADIHARVSALMRVSVIARGVAFSAAATGLSVVILWIVVGGLTFRGGSLLEMFYVHSYAEATAIVIPVPGGIGVSDSSMAGLLNSLSIGWVRATYVVLAIRSVDLLFKTVVGTICLVAFYHRLLASALKLRHRARTAHRHARRAWRFGRGTAASGARHSRAESVWRRLRSGGVAGGAPSSTETGNHPAATPPVVRAVGTGETNVRPGRD